MRRSRQVASTAPLAELRNDGSELPTLAFSSDGRWLATTGGADLRVFDTQTWRPVLTIRGPGIRYLAFDPTDSAKIIMLINPALVTPMTFHRLQNIDVLFFR